MSKLFFLVAFFLPFALISADLLVKLPKKSLISADLLVKLPKKSYKILFCERAEFYSERHIIDQEMAKSDVLARLKELKNDDKATDQDRFQWSKAALKIIEHFAPSDNSQNNG
jgi:hypothetical protein